MNGLGKLTRTEAKLFFRHSPTVGYGIVVPLVVLVILALVPAMRDRRPGHDLPLFEYFLPILIGMSLVILGLNLLPAHVAAYRERGVLLRMSTTPMRPLKLLAAHTLVSIAVSVGVTVLMIVIGGLLTGSPFLPGDPLGFLLPFVLTMTTMVALGMLVASRAPGEFVALGIGFGLFFPLLFMAGLWTPGPLAPDWLVQVGQFTPLGAGVQAMQDAWVGEFPAAVPLLVLVAYSVAGTAAAVRLFRWE